MHTGTLIHVLYPVISHAVTLARLHISAVNIPDAALWATAL